MPALIARFIVNDIENLSISDESFLKNQVAKISAHIKNIPQAEQQQLALLWISASRKVTPGLAKKNII